MVPCMLQTTLYSTPSLARGERLLHPHIMIGQEIQLGSSCPIRAKELYLLSNQIGVCNNRLPLLQLLNKGFANK